eukprot:NODE_662_length_5423_cov_0.101991.p2 type:complete len:299 gc:universal NODE_662_length_5423_cov_0.101991:1843-947(-)
MGKKLEVFSTFLLSLVFYYIEIFMMWDSFSVVDDIIAGPDQLEKKMPTIMENAKAESQAQVHQSPPELVKFDILEHLKNSTDKRKQQLIYQHHELGEKLNRKHVYETPLKNKSNSKVPQVPSPMKSVDTISTLKRFDSKFDDWHINENELDRKPGDYTEFKNELIDISQSAANVKIDKETGNSSDLATPLVKLDAGIQTEYMGNVISTQTEAQLKDVGIQTDLDYFDPLLSFSKQSIEKELKLQPPVMKKEPTYDTLAVKNEVPVINASNKRANVPTYKRILIERFLDDVHKLMRNTL